MPRIANDTSDLTGLPSDAPVRALGVRSWFVVPLGLDGRRLGVLCVLDAAPRSWSGREAEALQDLAAAAVSEIALRDERSRRERAEDERRESESLLQSVVESTALGVTVKDLDGRYRLVNTAAGEKAGRSPAEMLGRADAELMEPEAAERARARDELALSSGDVLLTEEERGRAGNAYRSTTSVYRAPDGSPAGLIGISRLVSERMRAEEALRRSEEHWRRLLENSTDLILVFDAAGTISYVSPSVSRMLGYSSDEVLRGRVFDFLHPDDAQRVTETMADAVRPPGRTRTVEVRVRHKNGSWRALEAMGKAMRDEDRRVRVIVNARDLTERQQLQAELRRLAVTDDLTGLNNRRGFFMLAEQEMKLARRLKKDLVLLFIDVDDFKSINDRFGHQAGDQALAEVAEILRATFRESDVLARLGGDEFVALVMLGPEETSDHLVPRLEVTLAEHNERTDRRYRIALSVGVARFDANGAVSLAELMALADDSLYERKRAKTRG